MSPAPNIRKFSAFLSAVVLATLVASNADATGGGGGGGGGGGDGGGGASSSSAPPPGFVDDGHEAGGIAVEESVATPSGLSGLATQVERGNQAWSGHAGPALQRVWAAHGAAVWSGVASAGISALTREAADAVAANRGAGPAGAATAWSGATGDRGSARSGRNGVVGAIDEQQSSAMSSARSATALPNLAEESAP